MASRMILLFTDFGWNGPYVGQMKAAIAEIAPGVPVIDLMHDAPAFRPDLAAHLLAALVARAPAGAIIVAVVDPGVGTARPAVIVEVDGRRLVGPDNGLFAVAAAQAGAVGVERITWRPAALSASFHGRDLFAPVAAHLAAGTPRATAPAGLTAADPAPRDRVVYIDGFGNAMTGIPADALAPEARIGTGGDTATIGPARTFGAVPAGTPFWYRNSLDLVEIAVNRGDAARDLALTLNAQVWIA